ncbi:MAG: hypothetical protein Q8J89_04135 [Caulobacter sp.]|nr:hypothetical protein [Caulobacter sp.]
MLTWEIAWPIGALILGAALAYGWWSDRTRNRANDTLTEEATRELYKHPETYDRKREELKDRVEPS